MFSCEYCETLKNTILLTSASYFMNKNRNNFRKNVLNQWKSMCFQLRKLTWLKKLHTILNKCQVENCPALPGRNLISTCNRRDDLFRLDGVKFHPGKPRSYNHHLNLNDWRTAGSNNIVQKNLTCYLQTNVVHYDTHISTSQKPTKVLQRNISTRNDSYPDHFAVFHSKRIVYESRSSLYRSSHRRCSIKKVVLKKFAIIYVGVSFQKTCRPLGLKLQTGNIIKKRLQHRCFSGEYCEILKSIYFEEHLGTTASACNTLYLQDCQMLLVRLKLQHRVQLKLYNKMHGLGKQEKKKIMTKGYRIGIIS